MESLESFFAKIPDPRKRRGFRHPLVPFLMMCTYSIMSGFSSNNAIAKFMKHNSKTFMDLFDLKYPPPGHTQIGTILSCLDIMVIITAFNEWAAQFHTLLATHEGIAGDGKGMKATVLEADNSKQDFKAAVSFFSHQHQIVLAMSTYNNGKESEIPCVQQLLDTLKGLNIIITLDALHCQKKQPNKLKKVAMNT